MFNSESCAIITKINFKTIFITLLKNPQSSSHSYPLPPPSPNEPPLYFLSLPISFSFTSVYFIGQVDRVWAPLFGFYSSP